MAWAAAVYPKHAPRVEPQGAEVRPHGWGGGPVEPPVMTWGPWVARVVKCTWSKFDQKQIRKD
eukprot:6421057-Lingulodinium_polyedra.AAC.1